MNKSEIIEIIKSEIDKFVKNSFDGEVKNVLYKSNSKSRNELIKTIKDSFESVYKVFWQKREFWRNDIK